MKLMMTKCEHYGTVLGCSMCIVDLTSDDDLSQLSALSIVSILLSAISISVAQQCKITLKDMDILCNGIIRVKDNFSINLYDKSLLLLYNKHLCISLLERWVKGIVSENIKLEYYLVQKCTEDIQESESNDKIVSQLYDTILQLYNI